ncbi:unnamed protein product [Caenorhabditis auriculariae]|uniref:Uncharacterized protein n=1 Tax=Caenorhabditis auriculariae TaxID=2777116 RepID=A0A8S1HKG1_9PELO|nr:unnamed protein product [Caenorhabditis auriculariae]
MMERSAAVFSPCPSCRRDKKTNEPADGTRSSRPTESQGERRKEGGDASLAYTHTRMHKAGTEGESRLFDNVGGRAIAARSCQPFPSSVDCFNRFLCPQCNIEIGVLDCLASRGSSF